MRVNRSLTMKLTLKKFFSPFLKKNSHGQRDRSFGSRLRSLSFQKWSLGITTALVLTLLLSPALRLPTKEYAAGDIAQSEVKSKEDLLVEDAKSTQEKRVEAERAVTPVYDYDPAVLIDAGNRIQSTFQTLGNSFQTNGRSPDQTPSRKKIWESSLRVPLTPREWSLLEKERFNRSIGQSVLNLITPLLKKGIIPDRDLLDSEFGNGVTIRNVQTQEERKQLPPFPFLDFREARASLRAEAVHIPPALKKELSPIVLKLAEDFIRPNLTFNKNETEERKTKAKQRVNPVYYQVKRGEVIVRDGERIQEEHLLKIAALRNAQQRSHSFFIFAGLALLVFVLLASLYEFSTKNIRKISLSRKDLFFFSFALIGLVAFLKLFQLITDALGGEFLSIPSSSYLYLFPIATGAMLVRIVINSEVAIVFAVIASYLSASLVGNQLFFFLFTFVGSVVGAHKVARCEQRSILIKAGLTVGVLNVLMIFAYGLISGNALRGSILSELTMGLLAGILASFFVLGIAPMIETLFNYTTDVKLLELANMDNPILKDLMLKAPGTYHHSIIVGTLVEAASKSIAANPLLSRVSAYYHDIGKLKKPLYFIENAGATQNKHENLTPSMSGLILLSHVKDGVELAREHHLGDRIAEIIQQHHGTSVISYFYRKAKEKENPDMDPLNEEDFRYPGPKPQTKEAGIVMMADAVEAASHSLSDPTPARIKGLIERIIQNIFLDGQLEECELTLKDLQKIEESFSRILTAIFHQRIEYPSQQPDLPRKRSDEDLGTRPAKTYAFRPKKDKKGGPTDLGQLGTS
jgi:cyclic-di-AMP phosphodiesterase PgpH